MVGLSVSLCVRDIIKGVVSLDDVEKIVSGIHAPTQEKLKSVISRYRESHWSEFPDEAERVFRQLLAEGRIEQPRLKQASCPFSTDKNHWVKSEDEIHWHL